ncbi:MAG: hypothetical protein GF344_00180, partial [Chitinivibrionales bacterium]|nr:hypothetical protein [Chitinivibrionales bacterium]MBD3355548.1 hypothetical protein [Chitinivibrionales bacterium]
MRKRKLGYRALIGALLLSASLRAAGESRDTVEVGRIKVVVKETALLVPAKAAADSGILEYLAVATGGKTYESVMELECDPRNFHAALLLLNAKPGGVRFSEGPDAGPSVRGDTLEIDVVYKRGDSLRTIDALDLISFRDTALAKQEKAHKEDLAWVFTGSETVEVERGKTAHASTLEGSLIGIFIDPTAEINISKVTRNPYRGEVFGFAVNAARAQMLPERFWLRLRK